MTVSVKQNKRKQGKRESNELSSTTTIARLTYS